MITIYQIAANGIATGATRQIGIKDGCPAGWTRLAPPVLAGGQHALMVGGQWIIVDAVPPIPPAPLPPLTGRRIRLALASIGITDATVETALTGLPDAEAALIEWRHASEYERDHPLVVALAVHFDLPEAQVDDLWLWASGL